MRYYSSELKPLFGVERFFALITWERVSEKSLSVSTLQASEPPYSINNSYKINLENIGKKRVIYKLVQCISTFIDRRKLFWFPNLGYYSSY